MKAVADNRRRSIQGPSEPPVMHIPPRPGIECRNGLHLDKPVGVCRRTP
jgi:hypothetical protein